MISTHDRPFALTLSGGIDSTVLAYWVLEHLRDNTVPYGPSPRVPGFKQDVHLIFVNIANQANTQRTEECFVYHVDELKRRYSDRAVIHPHRITIPMPSWASNTKTFQKGYVPNPENYEDKDTLTFDDLGKDVFVAGRNYMIFSWLLSYCATINVDLLLVGHQAEIHEFDEIGTLRSRVEDTGSYFIDRLNLMTECGFRKPIRVQAPFLDNRFSKYQIVQIGKELGVNFSMTHSCFFYPRCGQCGNCVIQKKAFAMLGVSDENR